MTNIIDFPGDSEKPPVPDKQERKRTNRTKAEIMELRRELWNDRLSGKTYDTIARERNMPVRTVIYNCQAAVTEMDATRMLEEEMILSLGQLNKIQETFWDAMINEGSANAADIWYKAYDRKVKLLGLEAPKRIDIHAEITAWAEKEGLDPQDVIDVTATLLPVPKPPSYST